MKNPKKRSSSLSLGDTWKRGTRKISVPLFPLETHGKEEFEKPEFIFFTWSHMEKRNLKNHSSSFSPGATWKRGIRKISVPLFPPETHGKEELEKSQFLFFPLRRMEKRNLKNYSSSFSPGATWKRGNRKTIVPLFLLETHGKEEFEKPEFLFFTWRRMEKRNSKNRSSSFCRLHFAFVIN